MIAHSSSGLHLLFYGKSKRAINRAKHYDGYYCLQMAEDADLDISYDKHRVRACGTVAWLSHPGPWIAYAPHTPHQAWMHRYVSFNGPLADAWWREGLLHGGAQTLPDGDWGQRFDQMIKRQQPSTALSQRSFALALELLLIDLAELRQADTGKQAWLLQAQRLLSDSRDFSPDIAAIAHSCSMPVSTFRRRFAAHHGRSPQQWAIERRLDRACELLQDPRETITNVAAHLGYATPFQLSQQFKRYRGMSPSAWRNSWLSDQGGDNDAAE